MVAWSWVMPRAATARQLPAEARAKAKLSGPEAGSWGNPLLLTRNLGGGFGLNFLCQVRGQEVERCCIPPYEKQPSASDCSG